jgi:hypothetical protein
MVFFWCREGNDHADNKAWDFPPNKPEPTIHADGGAGFEV